MLRCASSVSFISVDGTFSRCPTTHYQLVTCHAVCQNGFSFPFAFCLLPDKKASTYTTLFSSVDSISSERFGANVFSRDDVVVSCDFERGLIGALSGMRCSIKCCYFHHMQAIWRFLLKTGCSGRYCSEDAFRWNVRSLMVLPLLLEDKIASTFEELERHIDPADMETCAVCCHFRTVWICTFPPSLW